MKIFANLPILFDRSCPIWHVRPHRGRLTFCQFFQQRSAEPDATLVIFKDHEEKANEKSPPKKTSVLFE
jgi:hypothetical protein